MRRFLDIFVSDGYKMSKMKSLYIGLAVMAVIVLVSALAVGGLTSLLEDTDVTYHDPETGYETDVPSEVYDAIRADYGMGLLRGAPSSAAVLFLVAIVAALFVGADYTSGMMRLYVGRGAGKMENYVSKWLWIFIVTVLYVCVAYLMCLVATAALGVDGKLLAQRSSATVKAFGAFLFYALPFSAIFVAVPHILRSKAGGITMLLAMHIVIGAIVVTIVQFALGAATVTPDEAVQQSPNMVYLYLNPYYAFDGLGAVEAMTTKELGLVFGGGAMWTVLFFGGGLLCTAKADIK